METKKDRYIVIMAGGRGERFWPQSRLARPKHLLPIVGDKPMLTQTIDRLGDLVPPENVFIITNVEQRDAVVECCPSVPPANVVAEPVGRDTAAAVGLATVLVADKNAEAAFAMLPADHVIHDHAAFQRDLDAAFAAAEGSDALVTVGIQPTYPATGYGYIRRGGEADRAREKPVYTVDAFKEKPDEATAREYVEAGGYYWNAGMFFWRAPVIADCFARFTPDLWEALKAVADGLREGGDLGPLLEKHYPGLEKISVDYAIMEKAETVRVLESSFDWDDVGEWPAVARHSELDDEGNAVKGAAMVHKGAGNIVIGTGKRLLAVLGTEDLIVIETDDATLVCPKDKAQEIKALVKRVAGHPDWKGLVDRKSVV